MEAGKNKGEEEGNERSLYARIHRGRWIFRVDTPGDIREAARRCKCNQEGLN